MTEPTDIDALSEAQKNHAYEVEQKLKLAAELQRAREVIEKAEKRYADSRKQQYRGFEVAHDMHAILTNYFKQG